MKKPGLYANIRAKRMRGEKMREPGQEGAPSAQDFKNAAKTAKKKKGAKREDPGYKMMDKEGCKKCAYGKKPCTCGKKDMMGRKGPYADGCGYMKDSVAADFNAVLINDAEREDKPCGNSYIPQNAKCSKGAGQKTAPKQYKKGNVDPNQKRARRLRTASKVAGTVGALAPLAGIASGNTAGMVAGFGAARTAFSTAGALNTMAKAQATGSKAGRDRLNKEAKRQLAAGVGGTLATSALGALSMRNLNRSAKRRQGLERLYRGPSAKRDAD